MSRQEKGNDDAKGLKLHLGGRGNDLYDTVDDLVGTRNVMSRKFEWAFASHHTEDGDEYYVMRKRPGEIMWQVVSVVYDPDVARDMVDLLNRGEFATVELEPGQELSKK